MNNSKCEKYLLASSNLKKPVAFTLAEVLITLGIIGIVAALTLPNLIMQYQKDQTISQLKEVYTTLNNALDQAKVDYGTDVNTWYVPNDGNTATSSTYFAKNYLLPYLKTVDICGTITSNECKHNVGYLSNLTTETKSYYTISGDSSKYSFILANGAVVCVYVYNIDEIGTTISNFRAWLFFDTNGKNSPNMLGKDTFIVELGDGYGGSRDRNKFVPYDFNQARQYLLYDGEGGDCNKTSGRGYKCFALIMQDGWKITDDYPW